MAWFRALVAVLGFCVGAAAVSWLQSNHPFDFMTFWASARHWWAPYDPQWVAPFERMAKDTKLPFAYPPVFLLVVYPFGLLPLKLAAMLWSGLTLALLSLVATFVARPGAPLMFLSAPVFVGAALGQTGSLIAALMVSGMYLVERRPRLAGAILALAACIKPQAMLAAPIVLWGRWTTVKSAVLTAIALVAASLIFGPARWLEWFEAIEAFPRWMSGLKVIAPGGLFDSLYWRLAVMALGVWLALRRDLVGLVAGGLCFTPYAQVYDLAALALVAVAWIGRWRDAGLLPAALGALIAFNLHQTPLTVLLALIGVALLQTPWAPLTRPAAWSIFRMEPVIRGVEGGENI